MATAKAKPTKRGRPRDPGLPREQLWIRCSEEERLAWLEAAERLGMGLTSWIRMTCNQSVRS